MLSGFCYSLKYFLLTLILVECTFDESYKTFHRSHYTVSVSISLIYFYHEIGSGINMIADSQMYSIYKFYNSSFQMIL